MTNEKHARILGVPDSRLSGVDGILHALDVPACPDQHKPGRL